MTTADYRKPRTAYRPSKGQVNKSIVGVAITEEELRTLILRIDGLGDVQIVEASLRVSRYVYSYLLDQCDGKKSMRVRGELLRDTTLDIEEDLALPRMQRRFWFYVLNELVRAGVVLPVVEREEVAA
jgi:hypothetical protein